MPDVDGLKRLVMGEVDAWRDELIRISDTIHANPEIAFKEFKSSALLSETLEQNGFAVERGVAGLETAFVAESQGMAGGPTIAFLAEYDALPGLGHACGHNIIGTAAVGAGLAMRAALSELRGTIRIVGSPAEEGGGGKAILVHAGTFSDVDAAMMIHPGKNTAVFLGMTTLVNYSVQIEFFGKAAHAAIRPEEGVNALEAMLLTFSGINALRQHLRDDARIHGIITHGGEAPNIVPEYVSGRFSIRAADMPYATQVFDKVKACAEGGARATGARLEFSLRAPRYEPLMSNPALAGLVRENMIVLGLEVAEPQRRSSGKGSTDVGNVSQLVPTLQPYISIGSQGAHTREFCEAATSPPGHEGLIMAAKTMAMTAVDLLAQPANMAKVKRAFQEQRTVGEENVRKEG